MLFHSNGRESAFKEATPTLMSNARRFIIWFSNEVSFILESQLVPVQKIKTGLTCPPLYHGFSKSQSDLVNHRVIFAASNSVSYSRKF